MGQARQLIEAASQCCAQVRGGSVCTRSAVAWREGKPYCYAHDPDRIHLSIPQAKDRRRRVRWTAEAADGAYLTEIVLTPEFGGEVEPVDANQGRDWAQEETWWKIAHGAGIYLGDLRDTAAEHGLESPSEAIDRAYAGAGVDFPKRGSWSGETVWLFLELRARGLIDAEGNPT